MRATCETCRWFEKPARELLPGLCHRYPTFIERDASDYCGERKARAEKKVAGQPMTTQDQLATLVGVWEARMGEGSGAALYGRIGKALGPLVVANGFDRVLAAWRAYLAATEPKFLSPEFFASRFGQWAKGFKPQAEARPDFQTNSDYSDFLKGL